MATAAQKSAFVAAAHRHRAADMLVKGLYVDTDDPEHFHGCSVGCMLRDARPDMTVKELDMVGNKHAAVARHFGYPEWLAHLQDTIFERLPSPDHLDWHVQLADALAAMPDDHNWQAALHRVHAAILRISYRTAGSAQEVVNAVLDLHERAATGEVVSDEDWSAAESAVRSAVRSAAWSAARSAARSAAESAAWSAAESAAESAARSAAWSASWSAAESAAWSAAWSASWSAARSAARSAAESAAYQELRDAILSALPEASA